MRLVVFLLRFFGYTYYAFKLWEGWLVSSRLLLGQASPDVHLCCPCYRAHCPVCKWPIKTWT